jgi:hypothetical protein
MQTKDGSIIATDRPWYGEEGYAVLEDCYIMKLLEISFPTLYHDLAKFRFQFTA